MPADAVGLDPETNEDGEELEFAAAEGEVLRAVDFSFSADRRGRVREPMTPSRPRICRSAGGVRRPTSPS